MGERSRLSGSPLLTGTATGSSCARMTESGSRTRTRKRSLIAALGRTPALGSSSPARSSRSPASPSTRQGNRAKEYVSRLNCRTGRTGSPIRRKMHFFVSTRKDGDIVLLRLEPESAARNRTGIRYLPAFIKLNETMLFLLSPPKSWQIPVTRAGCPEYPDDHNLHSLRCVIKSQGKIPAAFLTDP